DAWAELHKKFGKLKFADDLAPAIHYAEEGFPVTELIAFYWHFGPEVYKGLPGAFFETYTLGGKGRTPAKGGFLRKVDFEKHTSTWVEPISTNYRGYDVFELPPNGQGIAALQILNILEGFDFKAMGRNSPETLHTMIEAKKIVWADRAKFYADPAFAKIPLADLLSKSYAAERRKLIDRDHAAKTVEAGVPPANPTTEQPTRLPLQSRLLDQGDTIYLCTADDEGNMVSFIQSNYRGMGSGIVVPGL